MMLMQGEEAKTDMLQRKLKLLCRGRKLLEAHFDDHGKSNNVQEGGESSNSKEQIGKAEKADAKTKKSSKIVIINEHEKQDGNGNKAHGKNKEKTNNTIENQKGKKIIQEVNQELNQNKNGLKVNINTENNQYDQERDKEEDTSIRKIQKKKIKKMPKKRPEEQNSKEESNNQDNNQQEADISSSNQVVLESVIEPVSADTFIINHEGIDLVIDLNGIMAIAKDGEVEMENTDDEVDQPWTLAMSQSRAPICVPASAPAPTPTLAPAPTPDHDVQPRYVDMMDMIMIVPEGAGNHNQNLFWLTYKQWEKLKAYWRTHEFIAKSEQAKKASAEAIRLKGERATQESLKSLQTQVLSHIACGRFGVPRSPPPHPDDDDIEPEDDGEYVDRTPDHEMPWT
ncbi:hypothetical protein RND71_032141 [Anisodus tanguticus]|uniref:Uncharacterized protein n=1 Tax=Anisodus tanguticus TaxID=243964 RepID=A0AAE1RE08_9SOLA|nr:hypothetical protein RND71_032141 [Anisodus tanguticus]